MKLIDTFTLTDKFGMPIDDIYREIDCCLQRRAEEYGLYPHWDDDIITWKLNRVETTNTETKYFVDVVLPFTNDQK